MAAPLKEDVTDEGILRFYGTMGAVPCPHCSKESIGLLEIRGRALLGLLGIGTRWVFRCEECAFDVDIPGDQVMDAQIHAEVIQDLMQGRGDEESNLKKLNQLSIPCLNDIMDQSLKWHCTECEEENPMNFTACWQCDAERPGLEEDEEPEEENASLSGHYDPIFGSQSVAIQSEPDEAEGDKLSE